MKRMIRSWVLGIGALLMSTSGAAGQVMPDFPAVPYATLGGKDLLMDIYVPAKGDGPFPAVVWIHGGGWSGGTRGRPPRPGLILNNGIAIVSIDYRLSGQDGQYGTHDVHWPAQIHDCKGAIRYIRANADTYGIDPQRIAAWGSSAGGHLSAMLAVSGGDETLEGTTGGNLAYSSRVLACVDYFGPSDLLAMNEDVTDPPGSLIDHDAPNSPESRLIGYDMNGQGLEDIKANLENPAPPYPALLALVQSASPYLLVKGDGARILIEHGDQDTSVPNRQSEKLHEAYIDAGLDSTFELIPGAGHGALGTVADLRAIDFLIEHLRDGPIMYGIDLDDDGLVNIDDLHLFHQSVRDIDGDGIGDDADIRALEHWVRRHERSDDRSE